MTSWMLISCLFPGCGEDVEVTERFTFLGSDIHVSACCEPEVIDVWVRPGESLIHWVMGCGAVITYAGRRKSESLSPWGFQSCSMDARLGL